MYSIGWRTTSMLGLALWIGGGIAAAAGSIEVSVRDRDGEAVRGERVFLTVLAAKADDVESKLLLRRGYLHALAYGGLARFEGLPAGSYAVEFSAGLRDPTLVPPADNPFVAEPRLTLFEDGEHLQVEVELWHGVPVTAYLELPENRYSGFQAIFEHRETGLVLASRFHQHVPSVERLLVPGVWDVRVDPKPGYLLVGLEQERLPLPGSSARLDLAADPRATWLTWTYAAPCELFGDVVEATGRAPAVHVEATLIEPGPWIEAARARGGSTYEEVVAAVDQHSGRYEMVLPDGRWRVRPAGSLLVESEPEHVDLDLDPGAAGRADFTIRLEPEVDGGSLLVAVLDSRSKPVAGAVAEVYELDGPETPLRTGTADSRGRMALAGIPEGDYLIVAGHPDHLEGTLELLEYDPRQRSQVQVFLPAGAEVRVRAFDVEDEPLGEVAVTLERQGEPYPLRLQSSDVRAAKNLRTLVTDPTGRVASHGFYPGSYRAQARLRGRESSRGIFRLEVAGGGSGDDVEIEISGSEVIDLEARLRSAAGLSATLLCGDDWSLPDTADVRVVASGDDEPVLSLQGLFLGGHEPLTAGPLRQGVYRLAVRPAGFDRWTWWFETHDMHDATDIQVDAGAADADGTVDVGLFQVECGPAVDLLPVIAGGAEFPDLDEVEVEVRSFDPHSGEESRRPPTVSRHGGRLQLRDFSPPAVPRTTPLSGGATRLEITLVHPHLLPAPVQRWQADLELERGSYEEIVLQVESLGGAVVVEGDGAVARISGPAGSPADEVCEARFADGKAEIPSLVPGRYSLRAEDASGELLQEWEAVEIRAGQTLRLERSEDPQR